MAGITKAGADMRLLPGGLNRSNSLTIGGKRRASSTSTRSSTLPVNLNLGGMAFDAVEELPNPKIEIPFDGDTIIDGNPGDLDEFKEEMWKRLK
jgi:hypothetical protein